MKLAAGKRSVKGRRKREKTENFFRFSWRAIRGAVSLQFSKGWSFARCAYATCWKPRGRAFRFGLASREFDCDGVREESFENMNLNVVRLGDGQRPDVEKSSSPNQRMRRRELAKLYEDL